jgi:CRISPR-associated protein (TIGR03984 family)
MNGLHWRATGDDATLADVLAGAAGVWREPPPIGLASTTSWHGFVRLVGDELVAADRTVDRDEIFDARLFSEDVELRWLHQGAGLGKAVLLAESAGALAAAGPVFGPAADEPVADTRAGFMALWGTSGGPDRDWYVLREHRIGRLPVPIAPPPDNRSHLALRVREYIGRDEHGNAHVIDERLLGLIWRPVQSTEEKLEDPR